MEKGNSVIILMEYQNVYYFNLWVNLQNLCHLLSEWESI